MHKRLLSVILVAGLLFIGQAQAGQLSRLHQADIQAGQVVNPDHLNNEFNQLVTESNNQDNRLTNIETGNATISGNKTFSGNVTLSGTSKLLTVNSGFTTYFYGPMFAFNGIGLGLIVDPSSPTNGQVWVNNTSNTPKVRINGVTKTLATTDQIGLPAKYMAGPPPVWVSASQVKIPSGFRCRDDANGYDIIFTADKTADITVSGANGLDNGTEANNTWYYLWAIAKSSDGTTAALLSASRTSSTLPSGYDKKRLLPIAFRNNNSGNLLEAYVSSGWPGRPVILYSLQNTHWTGSWSVSPNNALSAGNSGTFASVSLAAFVPPNATEAVLSHAQESSGRVEYRPAGASHNGWGVGGGLSIEGVRFQIQTSAAQAVEYKVVNGTPYAYLDAMGFIVTEDF